MKPRLACVLHACLVCVLACGNLFAGEEHYDLAFSTYIGGSKWEHARDVFADKHGNVYVVGGTASPDFPTTPGAYDRTFGIGGKETGSGGPCDAFVMKFGPGGNLIWSTYLGGPGYDRAYAVEVDANGYIYVAGRCGPGFPVTPGAFQTEYKGTYGDFYGAQNGFAAKLAPDGKRLIWASYVGVGELCRDLAIDEDGDVYVPLTYVPRSASVSPPKWFSTAFTNAFQKAPRGATECGVVKIKSDGSQVVWATWIGGSAEETQEASIRVDPRKRVYLALRTKSVDIPTTPGAYDRSHNGAEDGYIALLKSDGSDLIYATYIGGSKNEEMETHGLAIDNQGNAYLSFCTQSADFPTTPGAYDRTHGGPTDIAVVKLSPSGDLLGSTFIGGSDADNPDGLYVDASGNVFFVGETSSPDFPVTANAYQATFGGDRDAVVVRLSSDLSRLLYSTFMGGPAYDNGRSAYLGTDGSLYMTGAANGPGWPAKDAYQDTFAGGGAGWGNGDCILARFRRLDAAPASLSDATGTESRIKPADAERVAPADVDQPRR